MYINSIMKDYKQRTLSVTIQLNEHMATGFTDEKTVVDDWRGFCGILDRWSD